MSGLIRVIEAAARDARRAEALMDDPGSRRALRADPESAFLVFELHASTVGDGTRERQTKNLRRDRGVRTARRTASI